MRNLYIKEEKKYTPQNKEEYGPSMGDLFQRDYSAINISPLEQILGKYSQRNKNYLK